jgi:hypothetical protein
VLIDNAFFGPAQLKAPRLCCGLVEGHGNGWNPVEGVLVDFPTDEPIIMMEFIVFPQKPEYRPERQGAMGNGIPFDGKDKSEEGLIPSSVPQQGKSFPKPTRTSEKIDHGNRHGQNPSRI